MEKRKSNKARKIFGDVKSFIVKRSKWLRGPYDTTLLDNDGKRCCLGFYAKFCGLPNKVIANIGSPYSVNSKNEVKWSTKLVDECKDTNACLRIININDGIAKNESVRETKLKKEFSKLGIKVKFVD